MHEDDKYVLDAAVASGPSMPMVFVAHCPRLISMKNHYCGKTSLRIIFWYNLEGFCALKISDGDSPDFFKELHVKFVTFVK